LRVKKCLQNVILRKIGEIVVALIPLVVRGESAANVLNTIGGSMNYPDVYSHQKLSALMTDHLKHSSIIGKIKFSFG